MSLKLKDSSARYLLQSMIKEYIKDNGVKRSDIVASCGITESSLSKALNTDAFTVDYLLGLAKVVGLDVRFYVKGIDKKK